MTLQRQEIKERLDAAPHNKTIVDLDEIIEKWVSWKISCWLYIGEENEKNTAGVHL